MLNALIGLDDAQAWEVIITTVGESINSALSVMSHVEQVCAGLTVYIWLQQIWCCDRCSDNCFVFPFCCGPRLTTVVLTLIFAVAHPLLPLSSNRCIALTKLSSDCLNRSTRFFQLSNGTISYELWHLFVLWKNSMMRHYYSRCKTFAVEM